MVRVMFNGLEYKQPDVTIRNKELALNFVCSMILPIDPELEWLLKMIIESNVERMNAEKGKEMLAEFRGQAEPDDWELGTGELGSENSKALAKMLKERIALEKKGIMGDVPQTGTSKSIAEDQIAEIK